MVHRAALKFFAELYSLQLFSFHLGDLFFVKILQTILETVMFLQNLKIDLKTAQTIKCMSVFRKIFLSTMEA